MDAVSTTTMSTLNLSSLYTILEFENRTKWYLSPMEHVVDTFVWVPFLASLYFVGVASERRVRSRLPPVLPYERNWLDVVLAVTLLLMLCSSTYVKYQRSMNDVLWMLSPCHFTTVYLIVTLLHADRQVASKCFTIAVYYSFFTVLALAVPDTSNLSTTFAHFVFWTQHWLLVFVPLYLFYIDRFPLYCHFTWAYYLQAAGIMGALICFGLQQLAAVLSGLNVNYLLYPPPGQPISGRYYLWGLAVAIMAFGYISGHFLPPLIHRQLVRNKR